jgi:hypothetical protein
VAGCDAEPATGPEGDDPGARVATLTFVAGDGQEILGGRRSPDAFRVRAGDLSGQPVAGAIVRFSAAGAGGGILSQPRAVTDSIGEAETYLLDALSGSGTLTAVAGSAEASLAFAVLRAPGELRFEDGTGAVGLPGKPHPDSLVRVQVLDTEGEPLPGAEVWFTGPLELSTVRDSSDADGWVSTVLRRSRLAAGDNSVIAFMVAFPEVTTTSPRPTVAPAERVIIISLDGLRGDAIGRYAPPTLSRLAAEGAFTPAARTVVPSLTTPAHVSLFSSVPPEEHGVFGDDLEFTEEMAGLDPLFRNASRRGVRTQAFVSVEGPLAAFDVILSCKLAFGLDSLTLVAPDAATIAAAATPALADPEVGLSFVHLPDLELAGHAHGFESPEYVQALMAVDAAVAEMLAGVGEETLVVITSDHGGGGAFGPHQHGSGSDEDVLIPMILRGGRAFPSGLAATSILDVAPTVLWALGYQPPFDYRGRILLEGFR